MVRPHQDSYVIGHVLLEHEAIYAIEFDIAVVIQQESGKQAKLGVLAGVIGAGGEISNQKNEGSESRVKFAIPITYPKDESKVF